MPRPIILFFCAVAFLLLGYFYGGVLPVYGGPGYLACGIAGMLGIFLLKRIKIPPSQACILFGLVFGGYLMARAMLSPVAFLAWRDLYSIEASLILYVLVSFQLTETKQRIFLLAALCVLLVVSSVVGVIQFTQENNYLLQGGVRPDYGVRASGLFVCPNHFAGFAELVTLLAFALALWGRIGYVAKILFGYCGCVGLAAVVLSGSRGGYLSIAAGGVTLIGLSLWFHIRNNKDHLGRFLLVVGLLIALVGGGVVWIFSKSSILQERAANIADTGNMRTLLWASAWEQHKQSPLFGTGAGTFSYLGRKLRHPTVQHDPVRVHNDYLELLAEYGWIGFILFAICLGFHVRNGIRSVLWLLENRLLMSSRGQSSALAFQVGSLAALVALAVHSVVDFNMHIPLNALLVAMIFGMLANPGVEMGVRASRREPVFLIAQGFIAVLGLFLVLQISLSIRREIHGEKARIALRRGDLFEAITQAKKGTGGGNATTAYVLGEARRRIGMGSGEKGIHDSFLSSAVDAYRQALQYHPYDSYVMVRLAQCLDSLGRYKEAAEIYAKLAQWDPKLARYHALLGRHYHLQGKFEEAKQAYEESQRLRGGSKIAAYGMSRLQDDSDQSIESFVPAPATSEEEDLELEEEEPANPKQSE